MIGARMSRATGALLVLALLLVLAVGGAFAGYSLVETKRLELDALQTQLDNLKRRRQAAPTADTAEAPLTVQPFLAEESFALAANALQKRVVGLIEETEGKLITVSVDPPVTGDADLARRVSVQVTAELTSDALQKVLYQLESAVPFVFVESFAATRKETADAAAGKDQPQAAPRLSVSMSVTGYRRKGSA
jgi:hypothetical protein